MALAIRSAPPGVSVRFAEEPDLDLDLDLDACGRELAEAFGRATRE